MDAATKCSFETCSLGLRAADFAPPTAAQFDFDANSFQLWRPQQQRGSRMASITSAFQQRQQQEQRPKPVALFSVAKAEAADPSGAQYGFRVVKIAPDGRCMFRALASGMSFNQGFYIVGSEEEEADADSLRLATADALCRGKARRNEFTGAVFALLAEDTLPRYCQRLQQPSFWGGNVELLVLSKMLQVPITVYQSRTELKGGGGGFVPIAKYGEDFDASRKPVSLLYRDGNHYDLLVK